MGQHYLRNSPLLWFAALAAPVAAGAQIAGARGTELNAAIDAFVNTSDARSAGSALSRIAAGVETLAQVIR